ncbi:hypothetical protein DB346_16095 [Verrucomicrobia bacterium LW23]|nr:hypothetical protein DB346_16095 [Verrucomicrobia bacterium LW23]
MKPPRFSSSSPSPNGRSSRKNGRARLSAAAPQKGAPEANGQAESPNPAGSAPPSAPVAAAASTSGAETSAYASASTSASVPMTEDGIPLLPPRPRRVGRIRAETSAAAVQAISSFSSFAAIAPFFTFLLAALLMLSPTDGRAQTSSEYPFRSKYPDEKIYWSEDMRKNWDTIIPVDVRGKMEYDVLHIEHARHVPLASLDEKLPKLRAKASTRPLVFYGTGPYEEAPYIAAQRARLAGYENVYVYDNGVNRWVDSWPDRTRFFGQLINAKEAKEKLIPAGEYRRINLEPSVFLHASKTGEYHIVDIRTLEQREQIRFYFTGQQTASIDLFLQIMKNPAIMPKEKVLIYDMDGTRTEALQYYLRNQGITSYYFLKGGLIALVNSGLIPKSTEAPQT